MGIYAEFPVFVVAVGLFFPSVPRPEQHYQISLVWTGDSNSSAGQFHSGLGLIYFCANLPELCRLNGT